MQLNNMKGPDYPYNENMPVTTRLMRWGQHYQLGIKQVDLQHQQLVELINQLNMAFHAGDDRATLSAILSELVTFAAAHFQTEEDLMEEHHYQGLDLHKAEHDALARQAAEFQRAFDAGSVELSESMLEFLSDWLRNHVIVADRRMGNYLRPKV